MKLQPFKAQQQVSGMLRNICNSNTRNTLLFTEPGCIQKLLCAWTGWGVIPEGVLGITIEEGIQFQAQTCFNEIQIPANFTKDELVKFMDILINFANSGFGSV